MEHNHFFVSLDGEIELDLAGELPGLPSRAVVNHPIQPRLFVLDGSGIGIELVRPYTYFPEKMKTSQAQQLSSRGIMHAFLYCDVSNCILNMILNPTLTQLFCGFRNNK